MMRQMGYIEIIGKNPPVDFQCSLYIAVTDSRFTPFQKIEVECATVPDSDKLSLTSTVTLTQALGVPVSILE